MAAAAIDMGEQAKWDAYLAQKQKAPDRRVMNSMDADTKLIHIRLEAWARWSKSNPELREYPPESWLFKWSKYGTEGASQSGPPLSMPEAIEITERAINKLGEIDRTVLVRYYLSWQPLELLSRACKMREREFQNVLRRARFRVRCYVDAMETTNGGSHGG